MKSSTYYDTIAQGYEELHAEEQLKKISAIKKIMKELGWTISSFDTVLDIACGTGLTTIPWQGKKTGLDSSLKLLEKAKQKQKKIKNIDENNNLHKNNIKQKDKITYVLGKAEKLPFPDHSFDWVFCITALQNFEDPEKALLEMKRAGKGKFIISFLKKSLKRKLLEKLIRKYFKIVKIIEEEKDIIALGE